MAAFYAEGPMIQPVLASGFFQVGWVVRDIVAAETFFLRTIGVERFLHIENMRARDVEGTYKGKPGDWVCHIYLGYAGETQIELVQHVSGTSIHKDFLDDRGDGIQHVAYVIDDAQYDAAATRFESAGDGLLQSAKTRIGRFGYFDTRHRIGIATELVALNDAGRELFRKLKENGSTS